MKEIILSFFDFTGVMVQPWAEAGYECYIFDIQHPSGLRLNGKGERIHTVGGDIRNIDLLNTFTDVKMVFGFPPCTDLAVSGAAHFKKKAEADPLYRLKAMTLVYFTHIFANDLRVPYMIENPISVISSEWRKPNYIFDPFEYGGYLPENDGHPLYPEYIAPRDAYTKKTCLWTGGGFIMPERKLVALPVGHKYSTQHTKLGGKSLRTKNIRSATPRGFAQAIFEANK